MAASKIGYCWAGAGSEAANSDNGHASIYHACISRISVVVPIVRRRPIQGTFEGGDVAVSQSEIVNNSTSEVMRGEIVEPYE